MRFTKFIQAITVIIAICTISACSASPQMSGTLTLPASKLGLAAVNDDRLVYVVGGSGKSLYGDIDIIDPQSNTIKTLKNKLTPRRYHSAIFDGDESIYILGGVGLKQGRMGLVTEVEVFNTRTHEVTTIQNLQAATRINTAVFHEGKIYVMGGSYQSRQGLRSTATMFMYDTASNSWSRLADMPSAKDTRAFVKDDFIYVVGGYDHKISMAVFERYSIGEDRWETLPPLPKGISSHSLTVVDNKVFTFGNYDNLGETFVYDFDTSTWREIDIGYLPSRHNAATTINGVTYVVGGTTRTSKGSLNLIQTFKLGE
ncbi:Kelch repeat-containing protein [Brumicola blandensis]|jgi:N-acetylneuraminic acid mutarotase|uniref:Kelch repeat-containing protein n=1 Tax=Brumicola blandensis TaxID=3075611 RepID=A0AAW8R292_9ALTE|nr:kelch repeat-containing protein [Alteromonas sp. W409]MDT0583377.1 kelch repeat-containing protein [Alteromonas sp. W409]